MSEMIIQEKRIFREPVTEMVDALKASHEEVNCCYSVCLQRAETGPLGESGKEAGVRRLRIDSELLIEGILHKKRFPLPGGVQAGLGP